jgi:hypothetical protein
MAARGEQILLQPPDQVPAVFQRKAGLGPLTRPGHQAQVTLGSGRRRPLGDPAADVIDHNDRVRTLMHTGPDHEHAAGTITQPSADDCARDGRGHASIGHRGHGPIKPRRPA